jgi:hypothetical protein
MRFSTLSSPQKSAAAPLGSSLLLALCVLGGLVAGWGLLNYPPVKVVAVALGTICIALAAWQIEAALYGVGIFLVLLQEGNTTEGTPFSFLEWLNKPNIPSLLEVLFCVVFAAFCLRYFILQDERYNLDGMKVPLVLYFLLLFLALAHGLDAGTDNIFRKEDLKRFLFPVLFYISAINILDTREKITRMLAVLFWVMLPKTYLGIFYYLRGLGFPYGDQRVVFLESGDQTLIVTIIVLAIALLSEAKLGRKSLLFMAWGLAPMLFALIFSYRRNDMYGAILSLFLLLLLSRGARKARLIRLFAVGGGGAFLLMLLLAGTGLVPTGDFLKKRMVSVVDRDESSNTAHMNEWIVTVEDTMKSPFFGLGLGAVHSPVPEFDLINLHTVHNANLMLWMKMGLFAVLLFFWCLYRYCRLGVSEALRRGDPLQMGLFSTVALWCIAMNVGPSWFYYRESCLMALVMAMVGRLSVLGRQQPPVSESPASPPPSARRAPAWAMQPRERALPGGENNGPG